MGTGTFRRALVTIVCPTFIGLTVAGTLGPAVASASPCRVRNVTQDTAGRSLVRMVRRAHDGDHIRVSGTCPGGVFIDVDITVVGEGKPGPVIDGGQERIVMRIAKSADVVLRRLVLARGDGMWAAGLHNRGRATVVNTVIRDNTACGEAGIANVANHASLRLIRSVVRDNTAEEDHNGELCSAAGAGIHNQATLVLVDSVVEGNRVIAADRVERAGGGGIANSSTVKLIRSVVRDNASPIGGGIWNAGRTRLTLIDSAVTGNTADLIGGGIHNGRGIVDMRDGSVVTGNTAGQQGGGIVNVSDSGAVTLDGSSSVTGNTPDDCVGTPAC